jgi:uncharacterized protein YbaR (Trm112 family)
VQDYLIDWLQCPSCRKDLRWTIAEQHGDRIEQAEARCTGCAAHYPVIEGIGLFITSGPERDDLWEQVESGLIQYLRQHPDIERQLMDVPLKSLGAADQFFRALVLEERGDYAGAKVAEEVARVSLYTPAYQACLQSQVDYVLEKLAKVTAPIVDLASGRCSLVEKLASTVPGPIVATDFSPRVLRRDRRWLEAKGLYDRVSLLAFDARQTPFKDGVVEILTTYLGLPNIREPGPLFEELRRIVSGKFLAVSHFYPDREDGNAKAIRAAGLENLLFSDPALAHFRQAGFQVELANRCQGKAQPTPKGAVLQGAVVDGFPVEETVLEWCVLEAT